MGRAGNTLTAASTIEIFPSAFSYGTTPTCSLLIWNNHCDDSKRPSAKRGRAIGGQGKVIEKSKQLFDLSREVMGHQ